MIFGKSVLGIIPARQGSKTIVKKNIRPLGGKSLVVWTFEEAKKSECIDRLILSSNDNEVLHIAEEHAVEVPFVRPDELAEDNSPSIEVVLHALKRCQGYDIVVLLQPTSPFRIVEDIDGAVTKMVNAEAPACVSVTESDKSPYWMCTLDSKERMSFVLKEKPLASRRQDLPAVYVLNGAVYVADAQWLSDKRSFFSPETLGYVMPRLRSLDIDNEMDLVMAEALIRNSDGLA